MDTSVYYFLMAYALLVVLCSRAALLRRRDDCLGRLSAFSPYPLRIIWT